MAKVGYNILIDHEESNERANNLSITGRVNNVNVAAVIRCTDVTGKSAKHQKQVKQFALKEAYRNKAKESAAKVGGDIVEFEEEEES